MSTDASSTRASRRRTRRVIAVVSVALAFGAAGTPATAALLDQDSGTAKARPVTTNEAGANPVDALVASAAVMEMRADVAEYLDARRRAVEAEQFRQAVEVYQAAVAAERSRTAVWDRIAQCETGGDWNMTGSRYSGGLGFANSSWDSFGGREFASNAGLATREQQIVVAERLRDYGGYTGWGCAYTLGIVSR